MPVQPAVVILGAGAAGVAAATKLLQNGFNNVKVLEAENRIGGRVYSIPFEDTIVDLGAQWVHGENGNIVYEMVKNLNLTGHPDVNVFSNLNFFNASGEKVPNNLTEPWIELGRYLIHDDEEPSIEPDENLDTYFKKKFEEHLNKYGCDSKDSISIAKMTLEWFGKFYLCLDPAESLEQISSTSLIRYKECEGETMIHWKNNGFASIFNVLTSKTPNFNKNYLQLNCEVTKIEWNQNGKVIVHCVEEPPIQADHVIVTFSLGVLKRCHETLFDPKLPQDKVTLINNIAIGTCHKILLKFSQKWWDNETTDFSFLWSEKEKLSIIKEFPLGPVKNGKSWLVDIIGFHTIDGHPNILQGWLVGSMVDEVELLPDDLVQDASMFLLKKFVGKFYDIPKPTSILRSKWSTNPHFLGGYSYVGVAMEKLGLVHADLAHPLCINDIPRLLFAGEATHSCYFSTVHGAIESGYREAERLINIYQKPIKKQVVIVGAGLAGLGAAHTLINNGITDFCILEAQSQAGGRIKTIEVEGKPLDLGAQWMHGQNNYLYQLARKNNLLSDIVSEEGLGIYVRSNGEIVDPFTVEKVRFKMGQLFDQCNKGESVEAYIEQQFSRCMDLNSENKEIFLELLDWHKRFQIIDNSCKDLTRLSAKKWNYYVCEDDEAHSNLTKGYHALLQLLLDPLPKDLIKFNSPVTSIDFIEDSLLQLTIEDSPRVVCDHLILTPSLGVLKSSPQLTKLLTYQMKQNIEKMGFGAICKIFLFFHENWWGNRKGFQLLWTADCPFEEKTTWMRHIDGIDEVFNWENVLIAWVGGDAVEEVERLPEAEVGKQIIQLLRKFLIDDSIPTPYKTIRTRWLNNPFIKGAYCHITPDCDENGSGIEALQEVVKVEEIPRILLAGEAVHESHYSTTHGAYESGVAQAQILCDYINSIKEKI
ncbi:hypothetical protein ABEB36_006705 [Hypothenemus hampei]|uniref:Amine oxidase domain-containing protein n=1 Tax=Hypothenemus hampei TaxID=57062 RepID=A0ABD1ERH1_HYPHA